MTRLLIPNSMQLPNVLVDVLLPELKPAAVKVLLVITRFTLGYGKVKDRISISHLERLTGLSREGVSTGIDELKRREVITVREGAKGVGSNEYRLNIDLETGELVRNSDQSETLTSQTGSQKFRLFQTHPNRRLLPNGSKAPVRAAHVPDPRVKELITAFSEKYLAKIGKPYVPTWGKDGASLKGLLQAGIEPAAIQETMDLYFRDAFSAMSGFDIGRFVNAFNRLNSAAGGKPGAGANSTRIVPPPGKYDRFK